jgi:hypothetical protein
VGKFLLYPALLGLVLCPLPGRGNIEEAPVPVKTEFVLCVTAFDVSALPPSQQIHGTILQRELLSRLGRIDRRTRTEEELARYEELVWNEARKEAASALEQKRLERDGLLFQGLPPWKYRRELKRINKEIETLEEAWAGADTERPLIEALPAFVLKNSPGAAGTGVGESGGEIFPPPPEPGGEEAFLTEQGADAFITGKLRSMYGRVSLELALYTRKGAFSYEKTLIYSPEDMLSAADELKEFAAAAASGNAQALLTVNAEPEDALVLVNGKLVRGGEALGVNPGELKVSVSAGAYESEELEAEIEPGETKALDIALRPLGTESIGVRMPGVEGVSLYLGALYAGTLGSANGSKASADESPSSSDGSPASAGESPPSTGESIPSLDESLSGLFELEIPEGYYSYINAEAEDGRSGKIIVLGNSREEGRIITFKPEPLPEPGGKPKPDRSVETLRKKFYGAYGRFWLTLPLAFLANGLYMSYPVTQTLPSLFEGASRDNYPSEELYNSASLAQKAAAVAWIGAGVFLVESLVRLVLYIRAADKEAVPLYE